MNNNNTFNNNFIGTTHLDSYKTLSNSIILTSNTLENHLYTSNSNNSNFTIYTSNILELNSSNFTNALSNKISKLICSEIEHISLPVQTDIIHTSIYNSNLGGEIRFYCASTSFFPAETLGVFPAYRTKIDTDGKLKIFYTFDPLISLTVGNMWIDPAVSIVSLTADNINQGILIGGLEAQINNNFTILSAQIERLTIELEEYEVLSPGARATIDVYLQEIATLSQPSGIRNSMSSLLSKIRDGFIQLNLNRFSEAAQIINFRISQNAVAGIALGAGGAVFALYYGFLQSQQHNHYLASIVYEKISSNSNLTSNQINDLKSSNIQDMNNNIIDQVVAHYNIGITQGFINCNISNQQFIPSLKVNSLDLNFSNINNIGYLNANNADFSRITTTNNTNRSNPLTGFFGGGVGEKIILYPAQNNNNYPYAIGLNSSSLWNSIPSNSSFDWYINGAINLSLTQSNLNIIGNFQENGINLSNKYLTLAGGQTITGNLNINGITTLSSNLSVTCNIGIGTDNTSARLHIYEPTGTDATATTGSLIIQHGNAGGVSSIIFPSKANSGGDYAFIKCIDNVNSTSFSNYNYFGSVGGTERLALVLGCENDSAGTSGPDSIILNPAGNIALVPKNNITYISGNVGIGTTNPSPYVLNINGTLNATTIYEGGNTISSTYVTNTNLNSTINSINNTLNLVYTNEKQYPPKLYDTSTAETTTTF